MVIKMNIEHVIAVFVETLLPRFSDHKKVLAMSFYIRASKPDFQKEVVYTVHLLFHRPDNYTKVLWNISNNQKDRRDYRDFSAWEVKCDHDSEWRTSGLEIPFFDLGFRMAKELDPNARPIDCEVIARVALMSTPEIVEIKDYKHDSDQRVFRIVWK